MASSVLSWLHIGDLHASDEDDWHSVEHLRQIVTAIEQQVAPGALTFAFLPGDNANHGTPEQYARIVTELHRLSMPVHIVPGDHDFEPGHLQQYHGGFKTDALPRCVMMGGRRALFLDVVSAGSGGADFRLGPRQLTWLKRELAHAQNAAEPRPLVFMHALPGDMKDEGMELARLLADAGVVLVDTGHTHYNELINDGAVIYAATRSTGQIEKATSASRLLPWMVSP